MAGKGSAPRKGANQKAYAANWEGIFGNKNESERKEADAKNKQDNETGSIGQANQQDIQK